MNCWQHSPKKFLNKIYVAFKQIEVPKNEKVSVQRKKLTSHSANKKKVSCVTHNRAQAKLNPMRSAKNLSTWTKFYFLFEGPIIYFFGQHAQNFSFSH